MTPGTSHIHKKEADHPDLERVRGVTLALCPVYVTPGKAHAGPLSTRSTVSPSRRITLTPTFGVRPTIN